MQVLVTFAGKSIGRETGMRPIPVTADTASQLEELVSSVVLAAARRCLPLARGHRVTLSRTRAGALRGGVDVER